MPNPQDLDWIREQAGRLDPRSPSIDKSMTRLASRIAGGLRGVEGMKSARRVAEGLWNSGQPVQQRLAVRVLRRFGARLPESFWDLFRDWIVEAPDPRLRDEVAEWLIGSMVAGDRAWLRVLRHWSEGEPKVLRRAGVLGALIRVRTMCDVEAALILLEPLMRAKDKEVQEASKQLLAAARAVDEIMVQEFLDRWERGE